MVQNKKRKFSRIYFHREVTLDCRSDIYGPCRIRDLSLGGMFVFGHFKLAVGSECKVTFFQTGSSTSLILDATARVSRTEKNGVAIEFTSMSQDSYLYLQTALLYESDDPLAISLEFPDECPFYLIETAEEPTEQNIVF